MTRMKGAFAAVFCHRVSRRVTTSFAIISFLYLGPSVVSAQNHLLQIGKQGTGTGAVVSSSPGIECGTDCSELYLAGEEVNLVATPDSGSRFAGWSGACSGDGVCSVTMDGARKVWAVFVHDPPVSNWVRYYLGSSEAKLVNVLPTSDGGFLAALRGMYADIHVLKLDVAGSIVWQRAFRGDWAIIHGSMLELSNGYFVFIGSQLIKLSLSGEPIWRRSYTFGGTYRTHALTSDGADGALIAGCATQGGSVAFVARIDNNGELIWERSYGNGLIFKIQAVGTDGYVVLMSNVVLRIDSTGGVLWAKRYELPWIFPYTDWIEVAPGGGFLASGYQDSQHKRFAIRLDGEGNVLWAKEFTPNVSYSTAARALPDGGFLLAGLGGWLARLDPDGNLMWQRGSGGPDVLSISTVESLSDGGVLVGGILGGNNGWLAKLDESGALASCPLLSEVTIVSAEIQIAVTAVSVTPQADMATISTPPLNEFTSAVTDTMVCPGTVPTISVRDQQVQVNEENGWSALTVRLSQAVGYNVSVSYATVDGSATAAADYYGGSGTLTIGRGQTEGQVSLQVRPDEIEEADESFSVVLSNPVNATIDQGTALVTILDNDSYRSLDVVKDGSGSGAVKSSTMGLNCGPICSLPYRRGATVYLAATPDHGSVFEGWGGACSGTGSCQVRMDSSKTVIATFRAEYRLTALKTGAGTGTVRSEGPEISCGTICQAGFAPGTVVTLTATPDADAVFEGWGGSCSGTGACQVTMDAHKSVTAHFIRVPAGYTLTVSKSGVGAGRVFGAGPGIDCGTDCEQYFNYGVSYKLVAAPEAGSVFTGWSGACSGTGACAVLIDADKTAIANFEPYPCGYSIDPTAVSALAGGASGSVAATTGSGCPWAATSYAPWLEITSTGPASGTFEYLIAPNPGPARTGFILVGDQTLIVSQEAGCSPEVTSTSVALDANGGNGSLTILNACEWTARSEVIWISITGAIHGTGAGMVEYSALSNDSTEERTGRIWIGDQAVTLTQAAAICPMKLAQPTRTVSPLGGSFTLSISLPEGCNWTAESLVPWVSLAETSGTGSAELGYNVQANPVGVGRSGSLLVNGEEIAIQQAGLNILFTSGPEGRSAKGISHPANPGIIYAAPGTGGILKSTDGGQTWNVVNDEYIYELVIGKVDPRFLWARGSQACYRSTDSGTTWRPLAQLLPGATPDPYDANTVWGAGNAGIWKATDGETPVYFPGSPPAESIAVSATATGVVTIYAVRNSYYPGTRTDIQRSTDGGATWAQVYEATPGLGGSARLLVAPGNASVVYAVGSSRVLQSTDGGGTWNQLNFGVLPYSLSGCDFAIDPTNSAYLYFSGAGVFRKSSDAGQTWFDIPDWRSWNRLPIGDSVSFVGVHPSNGVVYASAFSVGLVTSPDHGSSWAPDTAAPTDGRRVVFDPADPLVMYRYYSGPLYKTTDGGLTWSAKPSLPPPSLLAVDPSDSNRLWALAGWFYTSADAGETWRPVPKPSGIISSPAGLCFRQAEPGVVYIAAWQDLYKSIDYGESWVFVGTPYPHWGTGYFTSLASGPSDSSLYAGYSGNLLKSIDGGISWSYFASGSSAPLADIDPSDSSRIWLRGSNTLYFTEDQGASWRTFNFMLPGYVTVQQVSVDPSDGDNVYAATTQGVHAIRIGPECSAALDISQPSLAAAGGTGSVSVTATSDCPWSATSNSDWITITSGENYSGSATITYQVAANSSKARRGSLVIAGVQFSVYQESGASCPHTLSSSGATLPAAGGSGSFYIQDHSSYCERPAPAVSNQSWIYVETPKDYSTYPHVYYSIQPNLGPGGGPAAPRAGHIMFGGQEFTITQAGGAELTVMKSGTGNGLVTSNPAGIDCGGDCAEIYGAMAEVTLTATPTPGSIFTGWISGPCVGTSPCDVVMHDSKSVTAQFAVATYPLTVLVEGNGQGQVSSSPDGITCGADCTETYPYGTLVTLTATPQPSSVFAGWTGACSETGVCQVSMTDAKTVTAQFTTDFDWLGDFNLGGYLGVGIDVPQRAVHLWGPNAVFRMDRSMDTAAFVLVRTDATGNPLKTFVVGADASGLDQGEFIINDIGAAVGGGGQRRLTISNAGDVSFGGSLTGASFLPASSLGLKTNIRPLENALGKVKALTGVRFDWKASGQASLGVVAEEVARALPEAVLRAPKTGLFEGVNYDSLVAALIESAKAQLRQIETLRVQRERLLELLEKLSRANDQLENRSK